MVCLALCRSSVWHHVLLMKDGGVGPQRAQSVLKSDNVDVLDRSGQSTGRTSTRLYGHNGSNAGSLSEHDELGFKPYGPVGDVTCRETARHKEVGRIGLGRGDGAKRNVKRECLQARG